MRCVPCSLRCTLRGSCTEPVQQPLRRIQVRIKLQHAQCEDARPVELSRAAKSPRDIHADAASAWRPLECSLPQGDRLTQVPAVGLEHTKIRGCVEQVGILRERSL